jgi:hypothetical protein
LTWDFDAAMIGARVRRAGLQAAGDRGVVELTGGVIGHLLCWERHERDGTWYAWVSWVQSTGEPVRHRRHVVSVRAVGVRPLENPEAYKNVPRRTLGRDGHIRPWTHPHKHRGARAAS